MTSHHFEGLENRENAHSAANSVLPVVLGDGGQMPSRAHVDDAGLDLSTTIACVLGPGERATLPTGVSIALPPGTVGLVCPRSGLAARHGITVVNGPGIIDAGYRGEVKVVLLNTDSDNAVSFEPGDRIAQLVVVPFAPLQPVHVQSLDTSVRADKGFGSSGGAHILTQERKDA